MVRWSLDGWVVYGFCGGAEECCHYVIWPQALTRPKHRHAFPYLPFKTSKKALNFIKRESEYLNQRDGVPLNRKAWIDAGPAGHVRAGRRSLVN